MTETYVKSLEGWLKLVGDDKAIASISFVKNKAAAKTAPTAVLKKAARELEEYFAGKRRSFTFKMSPAGTDFQRKVWKALEQIPYGETRSYGEIARMIGKPKAARAVGMANNRNPLSIVVPCHRVIGRNGDLVGYGGGLSLKTKLLKLEGISL